MRKVLIALIFTATMATGGSAMAASGELDKTFGSGSGASIAGTKLTSKTTLGRPVETRLLEDGSTLTLVRSKARTLLLKTGANGNPVTEFGNGGTSLLPAVKGISPYPAGLAIQGEKSIVISNAADDAALIYVQRIDNSTGKIDEDFGDGGATRIKPRPLPKAKERSLRVESVEIDPQGRSYLIASTSHRGLLIRLTSNGKFDRSFGNGGVARVKAKRYKHYLSHLLLTDHGVYVSTEKSIRKFTLRGKPDARFKRSGLPGLESVESMVIGPDRKLHLAVGWQVRRLNSDGSFDQTFGKKGKVTPKFPGNPSALDDLALDQNGRMLLTAGLSSAVRLTPSGKPDRSFGKRGIAEFRYFSSDFLEGFNQLLPLPDGKVLALGTSWADVGKTESGYLAQLDANGKRDRSYGDSGARIFEATVRIDERTLDLARTPSGGFVAVGISGSRSALVSYLPNGELNTSFGKGGGVRIDSGSGKETDEARSVTVAPDGDAITCIETKPGVTLARVGTDGELVSTFGSSGLRPLSRLTNCSGVAVTPEGQILVGGRTSDGRPGVVRLLSDGSIDGSFGTSGWALGPKVEGNYRFGFAAAQDGSSAISSISRLVRFNPDGSRMPSFGNAGVVRFGFRQQFEYVNPVGMTIDQRGAVYILSRDGGRFVILKLNGSGKAAMNYGFDGSVLVTTHKMKARPTDLALQPDGKLLVTAEGSRNCRDGWSCRRVALSYRLTQQGELDLSFAKTGVRANKFEIASGASSVLATEEGPVIGGFSETNEGREDNLLFRLLG